MDWIIMLLARLVFGKKVIEAYQNMGRIELRRNARIASKDRKTVDRKIDKWYS